MTRRGFADDLGDKPSSPAPARTVESVPSIDVRVLHRPDSPGRFGLFAPIGVSLVTEGEATIAFDVDDSRTEERVAVDRTPCNYGTRAWWTCPACLRRCGVLYVVDGRLVCRLCGGLAYTSSQATEWVRRARKANHLLARVGLDIGAPWPPPRPRGRHRRTWERELEAAASVLASAAPAIEAQRERLARR
jgi:hypothetical protein